MDQTFPPTQLAVVGLGLMGSRMAGRLMAAGFTVRGFDQSVDRLREFEESGGRPAGSPAEAADGCWASVLSLPDSNVSRAVCLGRDGLADLKSQSMLVFDTTTGWPPDSVEIAGGMPDGITYCDATVSGNGELAGRGELVVMVGGPEPAYAMGQPIFEAIGRSHHHVGPVGSGSRMKLIVNHLLTIHRLGLAETLVVAELAGMDLGVTLEVLKDGLAYSKAMDAWGDRMAAGDHSPPFARLRQSYKDARLIVDHGHSLGAPIDLVEVVKEALAAGEATGLGDFDNSAVMEVLRRRARIGRVPDDADPE